MVRSPTTNPKVTSRDTTPTPTPAVNAFAFIDDVRAVTVPAT